MPLDTGGVTSLDLRNSGDRETNRASGLTPSLEVGPDIGAALKAARELRGLNLQELADSTRIRRSYLAAIEEMRLDELPSRPFTIGYIRAYAAALGLDGDGRAARPDRASSSKTDTLCRKRLTFLVSRSLRRGFPGVDTRPSPC